MTNGTNRETREAYARWLTVRRASGKSEASAQAFAEYIAAREREAEAYATTIRK